MNCSSADSFFLASIQLSAETGPGLQGQNRWTITLSFPPVTLLY